jgi:hypothetical protein
MNEGKKREYVRKAKGEKKVIFISSINKNQD